MSPFNVNGVKAEPSKDRNERLLNELATKGDERSGVSVIPYEYIGEDLSGIQSNAFSMENIPDHDMRTPAYSLGFSGYSLRENLKNLFVPKHPNNIVKRTERFIHEDKVVQYNDTFIKTVTIISLIAGIIMVAITILQIYAEADIEYVSKESADGSKAKYVEILNSKKYKTAGTAVRMIGSALPIALAAFQIFKRTTMPRHRFLQIKSFDPPIVATRPHLQKSGRYSQLNSVVTRAKAKKSPTRRKKYTSNQRYPTISPSVFNIAKSTMNEMYNGTRFAKTNRVNMGPGDVRQKMSSTPQNSGRTIRVSPASSAREDDIF